MAISEQKRLFVGNLPPDIQDNELKQEFSCYGAVVKVEIKQKKAPDSSEVQNTFAFVTIAVNDRALEQCLQEFKQQQYRGRYLQVTVARENFLEKLKREREEAAEYKQKKVELSGKQSETIRAVLPTFSTGQSSSSESSSDDSSEDESSAKTEGKPFALKESKKFESSSHSETESESDHNEDNIILKKKSKIFLENGKIKIDRSVSSGGAIHVIESKPQKVSKRELDEKSKKADQKRLDSMNKMKNSYNEQKLAIKNALAAVDTVKKSNKIIFEDDDDGGSSTAILAQSTKVHTQTKSKEIKSSEKKRNLFDNNDAGDSDNENAFEGNFEIKQQFEGRKGERLRKLQGRFQGDSRFKMDSKFIEDNSDESDTETTSSNRKENNSIDKNNDDIETNETDERQWQLNILESVIGRKVISNVTKETLKKAPPSMLRFDPNRAEHTKFIEPKVKKRKTKANSGPESKRMKSEEDNNVETEPKNDEPPVSMEHFYEVRGDLKKSMGSGGFSLLSMFNRPVENGDDTKTADKPYEERLIAKNGVRFLADFDPFKYDSSGDEADENKKKNAAESMPEGDKRKPNLKQESFFIFSSADERVSEGLTFFNAPERAENEEINGNDYNDTQRQELKNIVKRKIKKSIQNALPRNAKPNKRFKRFAKNL